MTPDERSRLGMVEADLRAVKERQGEIYDDVKTLVAMANRWKGAFALLLGIGGIIGWFADKIAAMVTRTP